METEKKFLLEQLPFDLSPYQKAEIQQSYIFSDPVIRVRQLDDCYYLTIKGNSKKTDQLRYSKEEFELELSQKQYQKLQAKVESKIITKHRYFIPLDPGLTAELDIYFGALEGLLTVEVEFENEAEAECFIPPSWFGQDVSLDKRYSNNNLAFNGKPE